VIPTKRLPGWGTRSLRMTFDGLVSVIVTGSVVENLPYSQISIRTDCQDGRFLHIRSAEANCVFGNPGLTQLTERPFL